MKKTEPQVETYRDLLEEHAKLRGLLHDLERILADRPGPVGEVVERLRQLRDLVDSHFEAEEASDCFPDLVNQAPRVSDRVKIMLAEHGELRAEIHKLVQGTEKCRGTAEDWDRLAAGFQAFAARLMHHEQAENELVQEVFTEDIGSKD
jgi:iron-sulfur cluster repair protein YtfE (RIC family)